MVLSRNPAVCPCYVQLVIAAKNYGSGPDPSADQAFTVCPRDYSLNMEHLYGLTPRWGGSYGEMRSAIDAARRRGLDAVHLGRLEAQVPVDRASLLELDEKLDEAIGVLDQAINVSPTGLLFQERARMNYRRKDAPAALRDANAALDLGNGGWACSRRGLGELLFDRAWAPFKLGRKGEAGTDITLALEIAPANNAVKMLAAFLGIPARTSPEGGVPAVP